MKMALLVSENPDLPKKPLFLKFAFTMMSLFLQSVLGFRIQLKRNLAFNLSTFR